MVTQYLCVPNMECIFLFIYVYTLEVLVTDSIRSLECKHEFNKLI